MKGMLIGMAAALLLAAGCASQTARPGVDTAPSQQAAGSGWSVPPGSKGPATSQDTTDATSAEQGPNAAALGQGSGTGSAVAGAPQTDHTGDYERETPVKPIVPAFPSRRGEARVTQLDRVYFGFDHWEITPSMAAVLDHNAEWLQAHPQVPVKVEGHTDERGSSEYNLSLGERRARAVQEYLLAKGIDPARMNAMSYGEEVPVAPGHTEQAYAKNRRVEFSLDRTAAAARTPATGATN